MARGLRVTDLKQELRKRECKPLYITWKGQFGKCLLHFGKRKGVTNTSEDEIDKVMKSLSGLQITIPSATNNNLDNGQGDGVKQPIKTRTFNVNVELIKFRTKDEMQNNTINGGEIQNEGVDAENTRIESVDTTTV